MNLREHCIKLWDVLRGKSWLMMTSTDCQSSIKNKSLFITEIKKENCIIVLFDIENNGKSQISWNKHIHLYTHVLSLKKYLKKKKKKQNSIILDTCTCTCTWQVIHVAKVNVIHLSQSYQCPHKGKKYPAQYFCRKEKKKFLIVKSWVNRQFVWLPIK